MAAIPESLESLFSERSLPEAILSASSLSPADLQILLNSAPRRTHLYEQILKASFIYKDLDLWLEELQSWRYGWNQLQSSDQIDELEEHCDLIYESLERCDTDHLKRTAKSLQHYWDDGEAILLAILFRIFSKAVAVRSLLARFESRAEVSRLHMIMIRELSLIDLNNHDSARAKLETVGMILDNILNLSEEPIPEEWIDEFEELEGEFVRRVETAPSVVYTPELYENSKTSTRILGDKNLEAQHEDTSKDISAQSFGQSPKYPSNTIDNELAPGLRETQSSPQGSTDSDGSDITSVSGATSELTQSSSVIPASSPSFYGPHESYSDGHASVDHESTRSDSAFHLQFPIGTLENTAIGIAMDIERVTQTSQSSPLNPLFYVHSHLSSPGQDLTLSSAEVDVDDDDLPMASQKRQEPEILEKDRYLAHNVQSALGRRPEIELGENDPKRLSVDVASLRNTLNTTASSVRVDKVAESPQHTLDTKIRHILSEISEDLDIKAAETDQVDKVNSGAFKLSATSTASALKEKGYGQTRKYLLHRPNSPPQVIWVRIIAERVMVRVGGGWTDLAEWLSNYVMHHSLGTGYGSPSGSPGQGRSASSSPAVKTKSETRSTSRQSPIPKVRAGRPSSSNSTPESRLPVYSNRSSSPAGKTPSLNSSPTPLGMAGPTSSFENGNLSEDKRAWVQDILRQVTSSADADSKPSAVPRKLFESGG